MPKPNSVPNVDHVARPPQSGVDGTARAIRSVDRGTGRLPPQQGAHELPHYISRAAASIEEPDRSPISWWLATLAFFVEGCASYGAALYPTVEFPIAPTPASAKAPKPRLVGDRQAAAAEEGRSPSLENSITTGLGCTVWADARPRRRWNWLSSIGEPVVALWKHWRRERDIQRAVAALAEYDDRTLRDLGICGRSDIERVVRHSRDY